MTRFCFVLPSHYHRVSGVLKVGAVMRFLCLEYYDAQTFDSHSAEARRNFDAQCQAFHVELMQCGHALASETVASAENTLALQFVAGNLTAKELSLDETKRRLVGVLLLNARDLNHALTLISNHPCLQSGRVEVHACRHVS